MNARLHDWLDCIVCVDTVCVGIIVYHGPRDEVMCFFEGLGFQLPPRKGVADFLQEITSRKDQKVPSPPPTQPPPPSTQWHDRQDSLYPAACSAPCLGRNYICGM